MAAYKLLSLYIILYNNSPSNTTQLNSSLQSSTHVQASRLSKSDRAPAHFLTRGCPTSSNYYPCSIYWTSLPLIKEAHLYKQSLCGANAAYLGTPISARHLSRALRQDTVMFSGNYIQHHASPSHQSQSACIAQIPRNDRSVTNKV